MGRGLTVSDKEHAGKPVEIKEKNRYNRVPALLVIINALYVCICMFIRMYVHVYTYVCMYVYTYVCM